MTVIRANCPIDSAVDLRPPDVTISGDEESYSFVCPKCGDLIEKRADRKIISLLHAAGVGGPAITPYDVIMFAANIDQELQSLLGEDR